MIDRQPYAHRYVKVKVEKNWGLNRIRTCDLFDTGAVIYQLWFQANWELVT